MFGKPGVVLGLMLSGSLLANPLDNPLIQAVNLEYKGAFLLDAGSHGSSSLHDSEGSIALAPPSAMAPNGSVYLSGNLGKGIVQFKIPTVIDSVNLDDLEQASTPIQPFTEILDATENPNGLDMIGSLLFIEGQLLVSAHRYYPASNEELHGVAIVRNAVNMQESRVDGYFKISERSTLDDEPKGMAGWMSEVPKEWQPLLEGSHIYGPADGWSISGRNAEGPALFSFNAISDIVHNTGLSSTTIVDSTPLMDFDSRVQLERISEVGEGLVNPPSELWSAMSFVHFGFIPEGSRTLVLLGEHLGANGDIGYKITTEGGRTCGGPCTFEDDDRYNYYWLFDLAEILEAKNGKRPIFSVKPYAFGPFDAPFQNSDNDGPAISPIRGGAYDPGTGRLVLTLHNADTRPNYQQPSVYAEYRINTDAEYPAPARPAGLDVDKPISLTEDGELSVTWSPVTTDVRGDPIDISHYRLFFEKVPHQYSSGERFRAHGINVPATESSYSLRLSKGSWVVKVRAISENQVPSDYAILGD